MNDTVTGPPVDGPDASPPEEKDALLNLSEALAASEETVADDASVEAEVEPTAALPISTAIPEQGGAYPADKEAGRATSGGNPLLLGLTIALVFIIGLALGFFGRPVILEDIPIEVVVTVVPGENQAVAQANPQPENTNPDTGSSADTGQTGATDGLPTPTIMDFVLSDARHFQGEETAPVTIIEFSDFN